MAQNGCDGLDNGVLPWHRLGHAPICLDAKEQMQHGRPHGIKSPTSADINSPVMPRSSQRPQRPKNQSKWASNGPGLQAVFLGPNKRPCGTGVFIPRGQGTDSQFSSKPAFSPVLLPSRVIHALNLNVHELGQNIKPEPEQNKNTTKRVDEEKEDDVSFSPEILLPEEWTY